MPPQIPPPPPGTVPGGSREERARPGPERVERLRSSLGGSGSAFCCSPVRKGGGSPGGHGSITTPWPVFQLQPYNLSFIFISDSSSDPMVQLRHPWFLFQLLPQLHSMDFSSSPTSFTAAPAPPRVSQLQPLQLHSRPSGGSRASPARHGPTQLPLAASPEAQHRNPLLRTALYRPRPRPSRRHSQSRTEAAPGPAQPASVRSFPPAPAPQAPVPLSLRRATGGPAPMLQLRQRLLGPGAGGGSAQGRSQGPIEPRSREWLK
ncbi:uncharacterized protein LOC115598828 isoform X1 [Calypte anna]|uniref:uncharacterized protein LOC115598828 isoform X1 n=1 Tax=Calypte anna TaxID=9244 RepID=UPI0011C3F6C0|nr:uncharacterized protein LOC115598828 isoform X1 [Calypte anna]